MSKSLTFSLVLAITTLSLLPFLSSARPCKTIFVSYYSFTTPSSSVTVYRFVDPSTVHFTRFPSLPSLPSLPSRTNHVNHQQDGGLTSSSIQDRAKDILIVVSGLLFGLGCGAIVASTMYLIWSMVTDSRYGSESDYEEFDDDVNPKKMGYVTIATAEKEAVEPVKN